MYRVTYKGPEDTLDGIIVSKDEDNGYQYLLKDENKEDGDINNTMAMYDTVKAYDPIMKKPLISSSIQEIPSIIPFHQQVPFNKQELSPFDHIIPNAAIKSSIRAKHGFSILFYLLRGNVNETIHFKYPSKRSELCAPQREYILSRDGFRYLQVFYAIFDNAVEARVKVTLNNKSGPFDLYGFIAARTSAITYPAYSSLIFCRRPELGIKVRLRKGRDRVIPLSRDVVAVPLGHQLILDFSLIDCKNEKWLNCKRVKADDERIVEKTLTFDAIKQGTSTDYIRCSRGTFKVVVSWCIHKKAPRKPIEAEPLQMRND